MGTKSYWRLQVTNIDAKVAHLAEDEEGLQQTFEPVCGQYLGATDLSASLPMLSIAEQSTHLFWLLGAVCAVPVCGERPN